MDIHEYLNNDYFLLTLTFGVYFLAKLVRKMLQLPVFNPILVSIAFMICFLTIADIDYETYKLSGSKIDFWLKPAVVSVVALAQYFGASRIVVLSLAAKSVTTPIAMEVTQSIGGIPSLTATIVVFVGIFGAITGFRILKYGHIGMPSSQGISLGTASHAVGTSAAMEHGMEHGAYASLGLTLNGIFTAILTPYILQMMGII